MRRADSGNVGWGLGMRIMTEGPRFGGLGFPHLNVLVSNLNPRLSVIAEQRHNLVDDSGFRAHGSVHLGYLAEGPGLRV